MKKNLLEAKLKEKGKNISEISDYLGIDKVTFYRKISGLSDFYRNEIGMVMEFLELSISEMENIFFDEFVAEKKQKEMKGQ